MPPEKNSISLRAHNGLCFVSNRDRKELGGLDRNSAFMVRWRVRPTRRKHALEHHSGVPSEKMVNDPRLRWAPWNGSPGVRLRKTSESICRTLLQLALISLSSRIKPLLEMRLEALEHLFFNVFDVGEPVPTSDIAVFTGTLKLQNEFFH